MSLLLSALPLRYKRPRYAPRWTVIFPRFAMAPIGWMARTGAHQSGSNVGPVCDPYPMTSNWQALKEALLPLLRPILPYPDLRRRRRIRLEARKMLAQPTWPGNDATPMDVAMLAMRRILYLQREVHRAARWRQSEAVALLARSSIETCLTGLYCLYSDDPVERLRRDTGTSLGRIFGPLADGDIMTPAFIEAMSESLTGSIGPGKYPPQLSQIAADIAKASGEPAATMLYDRMYRPLSTFFARSRGLALLRHVGMDGELLHQPYFPWLRRSAARTADACVGVLAASIAERLSTSREDFAAYADDHWRRVMHPITAIGTQGILRSVRWSKIPEAWRVIVNLRKYYQSEEAQHDGREVVEGRIREAYEVAFRALSPDAPQTELQMVIDNLVTQLASSISASNAAQPSSPSDTPDAPTAAKEG